MLICVAFVLLSVAQGKVIIDDNRETHCIYARNLDDLRYKEDEIDKDKKDGIKAEARYTSLNQDTGRYATSSNA